MFLCATKIHPIFFIGVEFHCRWQFVYFSSFGGDMSCYQVQAIMNILSSCSCANSWEEFPH